MPASNRASSTGYTADATDGGHRRATHDRILAAAREVFLRDGFAATNLNEIAARAGVGKGTVYRHFENKAELFVTVLVECGSEMHCSLKDAFTSIEGPIIQQIERLARLYLDVWSDHPQIFQLFWAVRSQDVIGQLSPELLERVIRVGEVPTIVLTGMLQAGIKAGEIRDCDAAATAHALMALARANIEPIVDPKMSPITQADARTAFEAGLELALAGLRAHPSS